MNIKGAEGMSPGDIRDEIQRGGRLVIYLYCVSILVMTFKRSAGIRLVKAGQSPVGGGLPWVGLSLLLGWWGFPWGPVYTVECIYRDLCGGIDVTDDVLRELLPAAAAARVPVATSTFAPPPAPASGFNLKVVGLMAGAVALLVILGVSVYCYQQQRQLTVVLASGLDQPYTVRLNGQPHRLRPHGTEVLHLPEGDFTLSDEAGGRIVGAPRTFNFSLPFFDHLNTARVAVINPDRVAVLVRAEVPYYNEKTTPPENENPVFSLLANQPSHFIPKPDYVIEDTPEKIPMSAGTTRLVKTRLMNLGKADLPWLLNTLTEKSGYAAAREHLRLLAPHRSDDAFLTAAMQTLKEEDVPPFFRLRLAERPVIVDWHRYYQQHMDYTHPEHDLASEYRTALAAEPANGDLMYLLGRQTTDYAEARRLWLQALAASPPCHYAHGAMGFDAMCEGRFAEAVGHYAAAEKAGLGGSLTRRQYRRQVFWALNQPAAILAEVGAERKAEPLNLSLADEEIRATLGVKPDQAGALKLKDAYLAAYKTTKPSAEDLADVDAYLSAGIAYQLGDLPGYAKLASHFDSPFHQFRVAVTLGELQRAAEITLAQPRPRVQELLLLCLLAHRTGDAPAADTHFKSALAAMQTESHEYKRAAGLLAAAAPDAQAICALHLDVDEKCVLLTALGLRQPADREVYLAFARKLNFNPEFPYQFLRPLLAQTLK